jgi:hypothetical protein
VFLGQPEDRLDLMNLGNLEIRMFSSYHLTGGTVECLQAYFGDIVGTLVIGRFAVNPDPQVSSKLTLIIDVRLGRSFPL